MWNEEALAASKEIILCEALIDALTFWSAGFRNVTASYGVHGFTDDHRRAFEKYGTERVYIAYDRDEAGDKAADTLAEELMGMGIECFRVLFPKGMDANDYARKVQPAAKSLGLLLNRAAWLGKGQRPAGAGCWFRLPCRSRVHVIEPTEEPAAKEKIIEEQAPEPGPAAVASIEAEPSRASASRQRAVGLDGQSLAVPVEVRGEDIFLMQGDRRYRVRGLSKNMSYELLKVNVLLTGTNTRGESGFHVDTLDLYSARQRERLRQTSASRSWASRKMSSGATWAACC